MASSRDISQSTYEMRTSYGTDTSQNSCINSNFYESNLGCDSKSNNMTVCKIDSNMFVHNEKSALKPEKHMNSSSHVSIKLYKRRFLMLFIFFLCSMMNGVPQFQYTVVADIISCHYDVTLSDVNWASIVYMVVFLPLVFPVMYLMDTKGLRLTLIIGGVFNLAGSLVQCCSFAPNHFAFVLVCQSVYAIGQVFVLSLPSFIAGVWFGANEVGLACAMGVFGNQLGIAIGFIIPPLVLKNDCKDIKNLNRELSMLAYPQVAINLIILILILVVFEEKPEMYPSIAQAMKQRKMPAYLESLKKLFKDVPFVLLLNSYGLITGVYFAMSTILNEMVLFHFPGREVDAGWMGATMVFAGMIGSVLIGVFLDKTHKYKQISLFLFVVSFFLMIGYTLLIKLNHISIQYTFFTLLGFFMTGYLPAGFDFGAEITYPETEAMSGSLLNASTQIYSIIFTNISSALLQKYGDFSSNLLFCASLLLGAFLIGCMKCKLKRTNASIRSPKSQP